MTGNGHANGRSNGHAKAIVAPAADGIDPADLDAAKAIRRIVAGGKVLDATRSRVLESPWAPLLLNVAAAGPDPGKCDALIGRHLKSLGQREADRAGAMRRALDLAAVAIATEPDEREAGRPPFRLDIMGMTTFNRAMFRMEWIVRRILVAEQPCVMAASKKGMKTSIGTDLAISAAAADPFLGHFEIPEPVATLFLSGESGGFVLQDTVRRICRSKGIDPEILEGKFFIGFNLPQLSCREHLEELARVIRENGIRLVIIDPLYLCLLSGPGDGRRLDPANIFDMGPLFQDVSRVCLGAGATPILIHHFKRTGVDPYELPELENMAYAGIQEFARQWILLGRREKFEPGTGRHKLWLSVGGSAGHSGEWAVDVAEGVMAEDFTGREWAVEVRTAAEARDEARDTASNAAQSRLAEKAKAKDQTKAKQLQIDARLAYEKLAKLGPSTNKAWREALNWDGKHIGPVIAYLAEHQQIRPCKVEVSNGKGFRSVDGFEVILEVSDEKF